MPRGVAGTVTIREAVETDAATLALLIEGFAQGHPAASHVRSPENLRAAYFGPHPLGHVLLAERDGKPLGFAVWRKSYDPYWSMFGGEATALYVIPGHRGSGIALRLVAQMCADIQKAGGQFLHGSYGDRHAPLYESVAVGCDERTCHVSARAFVALASLAGLPAKEIVRSLPPSSLNFEPV